MSTEEGECPPKKTRNAIRMAESRARETPEQRFLRLEKVRLRVAAKRAAETPEQRYVRLEEHRLRSRARRARETPEERNHRLEVARISTARRRAAETPEQTRARREMQRLRAAARRAAETPEEKLYRKKIEKERAAWRRACETPERRRDRLERERLKNAKKRACETPEERVQRLEVLRNMAAEKRAKETPQERLHRLAVARFRAAVKRAADRPEKSFPLLEGLLRGEISILEREANAMTPTGKPYSENEHDMWMMCHNQQESVQNCPEEVRIQQGLPLCKGPEKKECNLPHVYGAGDGISRPKCDAAIQAGSPQLGPEYYGDPGKMLRPVDPSDQSSEPYPVRPKNGDGYLQGVSAEKSEKDLYGVREYEQRPLANRVDGPDALAGPMTEDAPGCFDTIATQFLEITQSEPEHAAARHEPGVPDLCEGPKKCSRSFEAIQQTEIRMRKLLAKKTCMKLLET
ncbi:UNVERIFIED_CONTAM: hypothetical protein PYX00_010440 [Menopon gallinae]|uniref:STPR domain-containing protein n=1 Tax=Menopon gallinae TaxID=328185 RepID=A0AAW2HFI0_9NEOP